MTDTRGAARDGSTAQTQGGGARTGGPDGVGSNGHGALRDRVRDEMGADRFGRYFGEGSSRGARLDVSETGVDVVAPTPFLAQRIDRHVLPAVRRAVEGAGLDVRVRVERQETAPAPIPTRPTRPGRAAERRAAPARELESLHRLDRFVVGESNRLAHSAAIRIAEGVDDRSFCPLFVHGPSGVGKTHLLQGVARRFAERDPGARARYTTAEAFTNEFIRAIHNKSMERFRRSWRGVRLLCLDDVHFLRGKEGTQQELLHTLDAIGLRDARIVLASDEHPRQIARCSEQLVSRFVGGAVVRVNDPDPALCRRLVQELASRRGMQLTEDGVAAILARATATGPCSVRELEGLLTQVSAVRRLLAIEGPSVGPIDADAVGRAFRAGEGRDPLSRVTGGAAGATSRQPVRFETIVRSVCEQMRVTREDLGSKGRHRRVVLARALIVLLAREFTTMSYPEIARGLRRPNHSTVITAFNRIGRQIESGETAACGPDLAGLTIGDLAERLRATIAAG